MSKKSIMPQSLLMQDAGSGKKLYNPNNFNALDSALSYIIVLTVTIIASILFSLTLIYTKANTSDYFIMFLSLFIAQAVIYFTALIISKVRHVNLANGGGFKCENKPVVILMGVLLIFGLMAVVSNVAEIYVDDWEVLWNIAGVTPSYREDYTGSLLFGLLTVIATPILPAFFEEWFYRGIIMKGLRELGDVVAIILSSFMFAIMHGSMEQFIYQFIVGFAIGSVVMVTGNYLAGCIMHFANNFFAQVFSVTLETLKLGTTEHAIFEIISMTVGAFAIMISICYFAKFLINKTKTENKEKSKFEMHSLIAKESSYEYQCSFEHYSKNIPLNKKGQDATVYMDKKGKIRKINYSSNKVLTIAVLSLSIAYGVFLVIVRDFGLLGIIIKNIFGIK